MAGGVYDAMQSDKGIEKRGDGSPFSFHEFVHYMNSYIK